MFKYHSFRLTTKAYTHVGQGAGESGVIDNLIQREKPYGLPIIHASSLKGAIREHCKYVLEYKEDVLNILFGSEEAENGGQSVNKTEKKMYQSMLNIHDARLLMLPVGALNEKSFYYATSNYVLQRYSNAIKDYFGSYFTHDLPIPSKDENFVCVKSDAPSSNPWIEGIMGVFKDSAQSTALHGVNRDEIALFHDDLFPSICEYCIPIIERNSLDESGISINKFNLEVLPFDTKFWFFISYQKDLPQEAQDLIHKFVKDIPTKSIQVGANSSLGQGFCKIEEVCYNAGK